MMVSTRSLDMKRNRFTEEQIIGILREQEAGAKAAEVCRKHASNATFYKWNGEFGGREIADAKRLKALEDENTKLKKLLAEAMLECHAQRYRRRLPDILRRIGPTGMGENA
jgi:putative transposase